MSNIWLVKALSIRWSLQMQAEVASSEISSCSKESIELEISPVLIRKEIVRDTKWGGKFWQCWEAEGAEIASTSELVVWFRFSAKCYQNSKLENVKALRTLNEDTQFIILLVLGESDTQKSGLTPSTQLGSGRTDTELERLSPAHTRASLLLSIDGLFFHYLLYSR